MANATGTPPHLSDAESELPPPSAAHGVVLEFPGRTTVGQIALNVLELDYTIPGLLRFNDVGSTVLAPTTPIAVMRYPRFMYIQIGAYSEYQRAAELFAHLQHVEDAERAVQETTDRLQIRIFLHWVSPFGALDQQARHISMLETILDRLRTRLDRVEFAYANGLPLQLSPRPTPLTIPPEGAHPLAASAAASETNDSDPEGPPALTVAEGPDAPMTPASAANP
eukprot:s1087_g28.t1